ncbi:MAG: YncE family protein [Halobacteriales archaeon]
MTLLAVACEGADVLALFDESGDARGEIAVGSHPVHATVTADRVFVVTMGERSVTAVEPGGEVSRVGTGVLGPAHLVRAGGRLLVPCTAGDAVAVIDPDAPALEGRVPTGAEPHDVGVLGDVAIAGSRTGGALTVFDPATREVRARHEVPDPDTARIQGVDAAVNDPMAVYAVDQGNDRVLLADASGIRARAAVGQDPYEATVVAGRVYVPGRESDTVHEFAPDLSEPTIHDTAAGPEGVVAVGGEPWVFHRDAPVLRSLGGREVSLPAPALAATTLPDGRVLCSHYDDDAVSLVDPGAGDVVWTAETPASPFGSVGV